MGLAMPKKEKDKKKIKKIEKKMSAAFKAGKITDIFTTSQQGTEGYALPFGPIAKNESTQIFEEIVRNILNNPSNVKIKRIPKDAPTHIQVKIGDQKYNLSEIIKNMDLRTVLLDEESIRKYTDFVLKETVDGGSVEKCKITDDDQLDLMGHSGEDKVINPTENEVRMLDKKGRFTDLHYGELMAVNIYTQGYFSVINGLLRGRINPFAKDASDIIDDNDYQKSMMEALCHIAISNSGLNKTPEVAIPSDTMVFRYDDSNLPQAVLDKRIESADRVPGNPLIVRESAFVSTSKKKPSDDFSAEYRTVFKDVVGRDVSDISYYPDEREFLMPPTDIVYLAHKEARGNHYFLAKPVQVAREASVDLRTKEEKEFSAWLDKTKAKEEIEKENITQSKLSTDKEISQNYRQITAVFDSAKGYLNESYNQIHILLNDRKVNKSKDPDVNNFLLNLQKLVKNEVYYKQVAEELPMFNKAIDDLLNECQKNRKLNKLPAVQKLIQLQSKNHVLVETMQVLAKQKSELEIQSEQFKKGLNQIPTLSPPSPNMSSRKAAFVKSQPHRGRGGYLPAVGKDYLSLDSTAKHIEYVYRHFLSKPYNKDLKKFDDNDWNLRTEKGKIERPNHALAHTLRVAALVPIVLDFLKEYNPDKDEYNAIDAKTLKRCQYVALFKVIGRENELGFRDAKELFDNDETQVNLYTKFKENSREALVAYTLKHYDKDIDFSSKNELNQWHEYLDSGNPDLPGAIAQVLRIAHNLDLMRCYDERQYKNAAVKHLTKCLGGNEDAAHRLCDYVHELMKATGNRVMGYGEHCDYKE